ncbi:MAG: tRNA pseudouridine(55) synthase TruB [Helicobacteraceae bacterium]|nr:tRNA pseudouridine(55) synthase TruB [Helicobacteraceae bacterium]
MNRLFVAYKPPFISSNGFLQRLKRKYNVRRAGFSGTLDPFASGVLIVAFEQYTRLFALLDKTPKRYRAVLWLGAQSETLDIEKITSVCEVPAVSIEKINSVFMELTGEIEQFPPRFSALKVGGQRAYKLARGGVDFAIKPRRTRVDSLKLLAYCHPFVTFECVVGEGCYVRSLGLEIAKRLGAAGALSSLSRLSEGGFMFDNERALDPKDHINLPRNRFLGSERTLFDAKKCAAEEFAIRANGDYLVEAADFFVVIRIQEGNVRYLLGHISAT